MKSGEVDGILMDRYTAFFYELEFEAATLFTIMEMEVQKKVLFAKELQNLFECLTVIRPSIDLAVHDITASYKVGTTFHSRANKLSSFQNC